MARSLVTKKGFEVTGLDEIQKRIAKIDSAVAGDEAQAVLGEVARDGASLLKSNAASQRWPHEAIQSIFAYTKKHRSMARDLVVATLFGIRKRGRSRPWAPGYAEWGKRKGKIVGESLATMFEHGTSKMGARPAMRPTVTQMRATAPARIADAFKGIIGRNAK